jgi:hypothetical protein
MVLLAEAIRDAALGVPGVLDLSPGVGYVEATYGRNYSVLGWASSASRIISP